MVVVMAIGCAETAVVDDAASDVPAADAGSDAGVVDVPIDRASIDAPTVMDVPGDRGFDSGVTDATTPMDVPIDRGVDVSASADGSACSHADGGVPSPQFQLIYDTVMGDSSSRPAGCTTSSRCHGNPGEVFELTSAATAFANLVNVRGRNCLHVAPCDPAQSSLVAILRGRTDGCGFNHNGLAVRTAAEIALVEDWIRAGAN